MWRAFFCCCWPRGSFSVACFESSHARWSGVAFLAATLSVPVTGTGLAIMDPYLTARSLSTPATCSRSPAMLSNRPRWAVAWLA